MKSYLVIGSPSSEILAKKIAKKMHANYLKTKVRVFPDGESKITILGNIKNKTIIIVSSTGPPVDTNLIHTLSLITKSRESSSEVIAVVPYMGYVKQDKEFLKGEIITIKAIAKLFKAAGATKLVVVDFHSPNALSFFKIPIKNICTTDLFVKYFKKFKLNKPLVVAPDLFWKSNAEKFANRIGATVIALNKKRDRNTGKLTIKSTLPKFVKDRDMILFDDMISSGGSIVKAIQFLRRKNFRKLYVVCTHPILIDNAENKIKKLGVKEIIGTNSVVSDFSKVDLSEIISQTIQEWK